MVQKVLVCITPQSNSTRLIDRAAALAEARGGELHILHIEKGRNLFLTAETPVLLQKLFAYGSERGGVVHGLCDEDVTACIKAFIQTNQITCVVLGEPAANAVGVPTIIQQVQEALPQVEMVMLNRENASS